MGMRGAIPRPFILFSRIDRLELIVGDERRRGVS